MPSSKQLRRHWPGGAQARARARPAKAPRAPQAAASIAASSKKKSQPAPRLPQLCCDIVAFLFNTMCVFIWKNDMLQALCCDIVLLSHSGSKIQLRQLRHPGPRARW